VKEFDRILVTGATGFVGPHVVAALLPRARVRALVRDPARAARLAHLDVEIVNGSLADADALARAVDGVDVVLHLAAATRAASEAEYAAANVAGCRAVVDAMRSAATPPRRLVYLSSLAAVGPSTGGCPVAVDATPRPLTAYGRTKLEGERVVRAAASEFEIVILRAPAVYGPGDRDLLQFFQLARRGILPVPTGGERPLQLIHVQDLARALALAATAEGAQGVFNVADSAVYTWEQVARLVARAVGARAAVVRIPGAAIRMAAAVSEGVGRLGGQVGIFNRDKARELLAPGWTCETDAARDGLNFEASIPLPDGLASTAEWYRANGWL
jgi:dihydroflavonol-4-reductase